MEKVLAKNGEMFNNRSIRIARAKSHKRDIGVLINCVCFIYHKSKECALMVALN